MDQKQTSNKPATKARQTTKVNDLPSIPDKRYFTIGEAAQLCCLKPHVLRYWEQEFSQLRPSKRRGNRRYYRHKDVKLVRQIYNLLYEQGYTIQGARAKLSGKASSTETTSATFPMNNQSNTQIVAELEELLEILQ